MPRSRAEAASRPKEWHTAAAAPRRQAPAAPSLGEIIENVDIIERGPERAQVDQLAGRLNMSLTPRASQAKPKPGPASASSWYGTSSTATLDGEGQESKLQQQRGPMSGESKRRPASLAAPTRRRSSHKKASPQAKPKPGPASASSWYGTSSTATLDGEGQESKLQQQRGPMSGRAPQAKPKPGPASASSWYGTSSTATLDGEGQESKLQQQRGPMSGESKRRPASLAAPTRRRSSHKKASPQPPPFASTGDVELTVMSSSPSPAPSSPSRSRSGSGMSGWLGSPASWLRRNRKRNEESGSLASEDSLGLNGDQDSTTSTSNKSTATPRGQKCCACLPASCCSPRCCCCLCPRRFFWPCWAKDHRVRLGGKAACVVLLAVVVVWAVAVVELMMLYTCANDMANPCFGIESIVVTDLCDGAKIPVSTRVRLKNPGTSSWLKIGDMSLTLDSLNLHPEAAAAGQGGSTVLLGTGAESHVFTPVTSGTNIPSSTPSTEWLPGGESVVDVSVTLDVADAGQEIGRLASCQFNGNEVEVKAGVTGTLTLLLWPIELPYVLTLTRDYACRPVPGSEEASPSGRAFLACGFSDQSRKLQYEQTPLRASPSLDSIGVFPDTPGRPGNLSLAVSVAIDNQGNILRVALPPVRLEATWGKGGGGHAVPFPSAARIANPILGMELGPGQSFGEHMPPLLMNAHVAGPADQVDAGADQIDGLGTMLRRFMAGDSTRVHVRGARDGRQDACFAQRVLSNLPVEDMLVLNISSGTAEEESSTSSTGTSGGAEESTTGAADPCVEPTPTIAIHDMAVVGLKTARLEAIVNITIGSKKQTDASTSTSTAPDAATTGATAGQEGHGEEQMQQRQAQVGFAFYGTLPPIMMSLEVAGEEMLRITTYGGTTLSKARASEAMPVVAVVEPVVGSSLAKAIGDVDAADDDDAATTRAGWEPLLSRFAAASSMADLNITLRGASARATEQQHDNATAAPATPSMLDLVLRSGLSVSLMPQQEEKIERTGCADSGTDTSAEQRGAIDVDVVSNSSHMQATVSIVVPWSATFSVHCGAISGMLVSNDSLASQDPLQPWVGSLQLDAFRLANPRSNDALATTDTSSQNRIVVRADVVARDGGQSIKNIVTSAAAGRAVSVLLVEGQVASTLNITFSPVSLDRTVLIDLDLGNLVRRINDAKSSHAVDGEAAPIAVTISRFDFRHATTLGTIIDIPCLLQQPGHTPADTESCGLPGSQGASVQMSCGVKLQVDNIPMPVDLSLRLPALMLDVARRRHWPSDSLQQLQPLGSVELGRLAYDHVAAQSSAYLDLSPELNVPDLRVVVDTLRTENSTIEAHCTEGRSVFEAALAGLVFKYNLTAEALRRETHAANTTSADSNTVSSSDAVAAAVPSVRFGVDVSSTTSSIRTVISAMQIDTTAVNETTDIVVGLPQLNISVFAFGASFGSSQGFYCTAPAAPGARRDERCRVAGLEWPESTVPGLSEVVGVVQLVAAQGDPSGKLLGALASQYLSGDKVGLDVLSTPSGTTFRIIPPVISPATKASATSAVKRRVDGIEDVAIVGLGTDGTIVDVPCLLGDQATARGGCEGLATGRLSVDLDVGLKFQDLLPTGMDISLHIPMLQTAAELGTHDGADHVSLGRVGISAVQYSHDASSSDSNSSQVVRIQTQLVVSNATSARQLRAVLDGTDHGDSGNVTVRLRGMEPPEGPPAPLLLERMLATTTFSIPVPAPATPTVATPTPVPTSSMAAAAARTTLLNVSATTDATSIRVSADLFLAAQDMPLPFPLSAGSVSLAVGDVGSVSIKAFTLDPDLGGVVEAKFVCTGYAKLSAVEEIVSQLVHNHSTAPVHVHGSVSTRTSIGQGNIDARFVLGAVNVSRRIKEAASSSSSSPSKVEVTDVHLVGGAAPGDLVRLPCVFAVVCPATPVAADRKTAFTFLVGLNFTLAPNALPFDNIQVDINSAGVAVTDHYHNLIARLGVAAGSILHFDSRAARRGEVQYVLVSVVLESARHLQQVLRDIRTFAYRFHIHGDTTRDALGSVWRAQDAVKFELAEAEPGALPMPDWYYPLQRVGTWSLQSSSTATATMHIDFTLDSPLPFPIVFAGSPTIAAVFQEGDTGLFPASEVARGAVLDPTTALPGDFVLRRNTTQQPFKLALALKADPTHGHKYCKAGLSYSDTGKCAVGQLAAHLIAQTATSLRLDFAYALPSNALDALSALLRQGSGGSVPAGSGAVTVSLGLRLFDDTAADAAEWSRVQAEVAASEWSVIAPGPPTAFKIAGWNSFVSSVTSLGTVTLKFQQRLRNPFAFSIGVGRVAVSLGFDDVDGVYYSASLGICRYQPQTFASQLAAAGSSSSSSSNVGNPLSDISASLPDNFVMTPGTEKWTPELQLTVSDATSNTELACRMMDEFYKSRLCLNMLNGLVDVVLSASGGSNSASDAFELSLPVSIPRASIFGDHDCVGPFEDPDTSSSASSAGCDIFASSDVETRFSYTNMNSVSAEWALNGDAQFRGGSAPGSFLRLAHENPSDGTRGSAWTKTTYDASDSWEIQFEYAAPKSSECDSGFFSCTWGCCDKGGVFFFVLSDASSPTGLLGQKSTDDGDTDFRKGGYSGLAGKSLAVGFDLCDGTWCKDVNSTVLTYQQAGIFVGGGVDKVCNLPNSQGCEKGAVLMTHGGSYTPDGQGFTGSASLSGSSTKTVRIVYDGVRHNMYVYIKFASSSSASAEFQIVLQAHVNVVQIFGQEAASRLRLGFTAGNREGYASDIQISSLRFTAPRMAPSKCKLLEDDRTIGAVHDVSTQPFRVTVDAKDACAHDRAVGGEAMAVRLRRVGLEPFDVPAQEIRAATVPNPTASWQPRVGGLYEALFNTTSPGTYSVEVTTAGGTAVVGQVLVAP